MSSDSSSPESPSGTLFDPPSNGTQGNPPPQDTQQVTLDLPTPLVTELREVARHIGMSPKIFITRALEVICSEISTDEPPDRSISLLLTQYQSRLDILRMLSSDEEASDLSDDAGDGPEEDAPDLSDDAGGEPEDEVHEPASPDDSSS